MKMQALLIFFLMSFIQNTKAEPLSSDSGENLYKVYCTQCHGIEGDGYGINVEDMEVLPKDHSDTEEMMSRTDEDLFKAIKHGGKSVDKSVLMPNWDANLSDEQINALVKYLRVLCCQKNET